MRLLHFVLNLKNISHILQFVADINSDTEKIQWYLAYVTVLECRRLSVNVLSGVRTWQTVSKLSFIFLKIWTITNTYFLHFKCVSHSQLVILTLVMNLYLQNDKPYQLHTKNTCLQSALWYDKTVIYVISVLPKRFHFIDL